VTKKLVYFGLGTSDIQMKQMKPKTKELFFFIANMIFYVFSMLEMGSHDHYTLEKNIFGLFLSTLIYFVLGSLN